MLRKRPDPQKPRELTAREQRAYDIGFSRVIDQADRPARSQTTHRRTAHITETGLTITEETIYTEEY